MTTRPPRTSVIVLNYNGASFIDRCLDAVSSQSGSFETVVVDNHSSDGSAESARRHPAVRVLALEANRGFAGGNNAGAAAAQATDYLVFLNNDTVAQPQWLDALVATLDARPDVALATSHIVSLKDPDVVDSAGDGYLWAGGAFKRWHGERTRPGSAVEEVFGACGASFAIRRSVFESLGGFDERFFMVYEDVDLSYRARLLGHRVLYVPASVVHHEGSASLGRASARAVFYGQRNLEWVWLKNTPRSLLWRTAVSHLVYSLAGFAYWTARGAGWACVRAKIGAIAGVPDVLAARRRVQASRQIERRDLVPLLVRGWWMLKQREKRARLTASVVPYNAVSFGMIESAPTTKHDNTASIPADVAARKLAILAAEHVRLADVLERQRRSGQLCCRHCGGGELQEDGHFADRGIVQRIWTCRGCGLSQLQHQLSEDEIAALEDGNLHYQVANEDVETRVREHGFILDMMRPYVPTGAVLDIGCSRGYKLEAARRTGWRVEGIELSGASARFAQEVLHLPVHHGTLETYLPPEPFDAVVAWHVLEHVPSVTAFLDQVNDLLRLGGHAFIQVPSYGLYRQVPDWAAHPENFCAVHYWYFTAETLKRLAQVSGLEPVFVHDDVPHKHLTVIARKSREALARTPSTS